MLKFKTHAYDIKYIYFKLCGYPTEEESVGIIESDYMIALKCLL